MAGDGGKPAAFLAGLLNSQPLGFLFAVGAAEDAKRHGVEVRPPEVWVSNWEATLGQQTTGQERAVRLGLNIIKVMTLEAAWRIKEGRPVAQFASTSDLAARTARDAGYMDALAQADARRSLSGNRRQAMWQAKSSVPDKAFLRPAEITEDLLELEAPKEAEDVVTEYEHTGLTLRRHRLPFRETSCRRSDSFPATYYSISQTDNLPVDATSCQYVSGQAQRMELHS